MRAGDGRKENAMAKKCGSGLLREAVWGEDARCKGGGYWRWRWTRPAGAGR